MELADRGGVVPGQLGAELAEVLDASGRAKLFAELQCLHGDAAAFLVFTGVEPGIGENHRGEEVAAEVTPVGSAEGLCRVR